MFADSERQKSSTRVVKKQIHGKSSSSVDVISHMAKFKNNIQVNDELPFDNRALWDTNELCLKNDFSNPHYSVHKYTPEIINHF